MSTKNRTRRTTTRNIRFPNQMIEQINIALEQKVVRNFSAWVIEACRRRLTSEKRAYTSIKSDEEMNIPRSSLRTDDIVNSLYHEVTCNDGSFTTFLTVTDCVSLVADFEYLND